MINKELLTEETSPFDSRDIIIESVTHPALTYPAVLDLRPDMPPVWDQGVDGPCSSYAAAAIKCWQEKKDYGLTKPLSRYFLYNIRPNKPQKGMNPRMTMKLLQKWGIPLERSFNHRRMKNLEDIPQSVLDEAANHKIVGYAKINTIEGLKKSLLVNGPAYIALPVYNNSYQFFIPQRRDKMLGGHAAVVVGYNREGFIIRNSWGINWGQRGHCTYYYKDFGVHMEIWTAIDDKSSAVNTHKNNKSENRQNIFSIFKRIFKS